MAAQHIPPFMFMSFHLLTTGVSLCIHLQLIISFGNLISSWKSFFCIRLVRQCNDANRVGSIWSPFSSGPAVAMLGQRDELRYIVVLSFMGSHWCSFLSIKRWMIVCSGALLDTNWSCVLVGYPWGKDITLNSKAGEKKGQQWPNANMFFFFFFVHQG